MAFAQTNYKSTIGKEDIKSWDGITSTFDRKTSTGGTITMTKEGYEVDVSKIYGNGAKTAAIINTAIAQVGSINKMTFVLSPGAWTIDADITVPLNIMLKIPAGALLTISTGKTLTIDGPPKIGLYQVFNCVGTGKVLFGTGAVENVYTEWWGAVVDDPTYATINYAAINSAIVSLGYIGIVQLNDGIYYTDDTVTITDTQADQKDIILKGNGRLNSLIYHIGAQTTGCIKIIGDATYSTTFYISTGHGRSHLEDIAIGSISGPGLHRYFTGGHIDRNINIIGAGTTSSLILLEGCIEFYFNDIISWAWATPWIDQIHSTGLYPAYAVVHPYNFIKIQDSTYDDGVHGSLPGICHEGWFTNIRDNGSSHTREALYIVSDTAGQGDGGNFTFSGCKITGPTGVANYGAVRVDGMNRGVFFTNGTYIEAQAAIGATQGNIIVNNSTDITKVTFSNVLWTGFIDIGEYGGSGTYKMHVNMSNSRGGKIRFNDASDTVYLHMVGNRFLTYPTTLYSALGSIAYPMVYNNVYEVDESTFYPITSESIVVGGKAQITAEAIATLSGVGTVITLGIPAGAKIHGAQFRVDTLITSAVGVSWSGAFHGGSTTALVSGQAFTKNTKASALIVDEITTNTTNIAITPNAGTFSAGVIRAVAYYEKIIPMYDAP